jgi:arylsulfatase
MSRSWPLRLALLASLAFALVAPATVSAQQQQKQKPNILVIMGDDIGYWNISAYNRGMMGYRTPNIDRIANEGAIFTDYYGQQSCTAGRAAFITGQSPLRTGLLKVGLPGAKEGLLSCIIFRTHRAARRRRSACSVREDASSRSIQIA